MFFPSRLPLLAALAALVALALSAPAARAAGRQEVVTVYFSTSTAGGVERFDALEKITPRDAGSADLAAAVQWVLEDLNLPANWRTQAGAAPFLALSNFSPWLNQTLQRSYNLSPLAIVSPVGPNATTHLYQLMIGAMVPTVGLTGVKLQITTWALPPGASPPPFYQGSPDRAADLATLFPSAAPRLAAEKAAGLDGNPKSLTQFLLHSEIDLVAKPTRPPTGSSGLALAHLQQNCGATLVAACQSVIADSTVPGGVTSLRTCLVAEWKRIVGTDDAPATGPQIYGHQQSVFAVTLPDLDPVLQARVVAPNIVMPANFGGKLPWSAFDAQYGKFHYGRGIEQTWGDFVAGLNTRLSAADALPPADFPRFLDTAERQQFLTRLTADSHVNTAGILPPSTGPAPASSTPAYAQSAGAPGELVYSVDYRPGQFGLTLQAQADSSRQLTGSVTLDYSLANSQDLALTGTLGTTSQCASVTYTQARRQLGTLSSLLITHSASYNRDQDIRLGTATGPLVTTRNLQIGPEAQVSGSIALASAPAVNRQLLYQTSASVYYRNTGASGPPTFLQPQPASLHGASGSLTQSFNYQCAAATPASSGNAANTPPPTTGSLWAPVEFDATASLALVEFLPSSRTGYTRATLQLSALQFFGSVATGERRTYLQASALLAALSSAAPRLDFLRLGGQDVSPGLDDGELAGRSSWNGALEGGWRLASLIPSLGGANSPGLLANVYLNTFAQYGGVARQTDAGSEFNAHRTAFSVGAGARLFGISGGSPGGSSLNLGYAWSPQSIRRSGRFYASVSLPFPP